jgi:hypothetical protein
MELRKGVRRFFLLSSISAKLQDHFIQTYYTRMVIVQPQAASVITSQPGALQLRYLQTLTDISVEKNSTIIFPLPLDILTPFLKTRGANEYPERAISPLERYDDARHAPVRSQVEKEYMEK